MHYEGDLYGKVGKTYQKLKQTTYDVDRLQRLHDLEAKLLESDVYRADLAKLILQGDNTRGRGIFENSTSQSSNLKKLMPEKFKHLVECEGLCYYWSCFKVKQGLVIEEKAFSSRLDALEWILND